MNCPCMLYDDIPPGIRIISLKNHTAGHKKGGCPKGTVNRKTKAIIQLDRDNNFIAEYESSYDAERKIGCKASGISLVCRGKQKLCKGYKFVFKEDYDRDNN